MDIASAIQADFEPFLNEEFAVGIEEGHVESMRLFEIKAYSEELTKGYSRKPFSMLFRGPIGTAYPQRIYAFHHSELGDFSLFLVPIREDADGVVYESILG